MSVPSSNMFNTFTFADENISEMQWDFSDSATKRSLLKGLGVDRWTAYCGHHGDEKLRAVGGGAGVGHAERVWAVVSQRRVELVLKLSSPDALPTHARACGVSCLDHEALQAAEDRRV